MRSRGLRETYARSQLGGGIAGLVVCLVVGAPWGLTLVFGIMVTLLAVRVFRLSR